MDGPTLSSYSGTQALIETLASENAHTRHAARRELVAMGEDAVPLLIDSLRSINFRVRWEAAKALGEIGNPDGAPALVRLLKDEDTGVRWAAMGSLVRLGTTSLGPLMELLTHDFHSTRVREGAHHVLNEFKKRNQLNPAEEHVFRALEGSSPSIEVPWAASQALKQQEE